jgi:hypothetical protein
MEIILRPRSLASPTPSVRSTFRAIDSLTRFRKGRTNLFRQDETNLFRQNDLTFRRSFINSSDGSMKNSCTVERTKPSLIVASQFTPMTLYGCAPASVNARAQPHADTHPAASPSRSSRFKSLGICVRRSRILSLTSGIGSGRTQTPIIPPHGSCSVPTSTTPVTVGSQLGPTRQKPESEHSIWVGRRDQRRLVQPLLGALTPSPATGSTHVQGS